MQFWRKKCVFLLAVSASISRDVTVTSTRFLHAGQGNVTVASFGYLHLYFCNLFWKCERPRIVCRRLVAYHCNFGKYLREQGNEPNFWGHGVRRLGKLIWYNETFATSADSDQLTHPHENGRYHLHADCTIWWKKQINKNRPGISSNYTKELRLTSGCTCWSHMQ